MKKLLALCCCLVVTLALPAAESSGWTTDYPAALEQAKADDRRVFLFFTGSDWCSWCKRLNREILSTPEFKKFADDRLVLVELDFPRSKAQPAAVKAQNTQLAQRFKIRSYPTIIVLDRSGTKIGQLGYQRGGPAPFIEALGKM
ncbi:MAG TPA: thioredoxin family protein, partial [Opitutus sp.]|nr:thioredoxin family protein [Opitutus sp.]